MLLSYLQPEVHTTDVLSDKPTAMLFTRVALSSLAIGSRVGMAPTRHSFVPVRGASRMALATDEAKALHALGYNIGTQMGDLRGGVFSEGEVDDLLTGIKAALVDEPPEVPLAEYVPKAAEIIQGRQAVKAEKAAAAGLKALDEAAAEEGATRTDRGLVIKTLEEGSGASPTAADTVEVHYEGTLVDGTIFDSSYKRGDSISFPLSGVIKGWTEGLQLMKVGEKAKLTIPSDIAYGDRGSPPAIPPKATLVFQVELLAIK